MHRFKVYKTLLLVLLLSWSLSSFGEGSKDLYPLGAKGGRAYLLSTTGTSDVNPYPTLGTQFVYVNKGEWISMASSMQGFDGSKEERIRLFDPNGNPVNLDFVGENGNISDRSAELAGPAFPGASPSGDQYKAIYYQATMSGIYKVQFLANSKEKHTRTGNYSADDEWIQEDNNRAIAAWDVSVCNKLKTSWTEGRVFVYVVNFYIRSASTKDYKGGFYGQFKVLTNDGYVYNVGNNGMNGIYFTFMVNNRGFHHPGEDGEALYKSINLKSVKQKREYIYQRYHDPRKQDNPTTATDKIFYNLPDKGMPEQALGGHVSGELTWMMPTPKILKVSNVSFTGAEGTPNQMGQSKGGYIKFTSSIIGSYSIELKPTGNASFTPRILTGSAVKGQNKVYFDGKDGDGNPIPIGTVKMEIGMAVRFAEVHFPFIDVEINPYGIIIELLKNDYSDVASDVVYWNDVDIPKVNEATKGPMVDPITNLDGISSNVNGHKWGSDDYPTYKWGNSFGDKNGMDTWTYLEAQSSAVFTVDIQKADLKISALTANDTSVQTGDHLTYEVKATNEGPNDVAGSKFTFTLPPGFEDVGKVTFNGNGCGTESSIISYKASSRTYTSALDLPKGCTVSYTFEAKVTQNAPIGRQAAVATILRTNDVSDPDATNLALKDKNDNTYHPTHAEEECKGKSCNNIRKYEVNVSFMYAASDINQTPVGKPVSGNVLTNDRGNNLMVKTGNYLDKDGNTQPFSLGVTTHIYNKYHTLMGAFTLNVDGSYYFIPEDKFTGNARIHYTAEGQDQYADSTLLNIKVIGRINPIRNDPPIAQNDVVFAEKDGTITSNVLYNDDDPDNDALKVTAASQGSNSITLGSTKHVYGVDKSGHPFDHAGNLTVNTDGSYVFTPAAGFIGKINPISFVVDDGHKKKDTASLFIGVLKKNNFLTFAYDDAQSAPRGDEMIGNILNNDADHNNRKQELIRATAYANGKEIPLTLGTNVSISGVGAFLLKENGSYIFKSDADFVGNLYVKYTVSIPGKYPIQSSATLYLSGLAILPPPIAVNDSVNASTPGSPVSFNIIDNDIDKNESGIAPDSIHLIGPSGSTSIDVDKDGNIEEVQVPNEGKWEVSRDGQVTFTPTPQFMKDPASIEYTVKDSAGLKSNIAKITVTYTHLPPEAKEDTKKDVFSGQSVSIPILDNDLPGNSGAINPATVNLIGAPGDNAQDIDNDGRTDRISVTNKGKWEVNTSGMVTFVPSIGFLGDPPPIKYTVEDKIGKVSNEATITIKTLLGDHSFMPNNFTPNGDGLNDKWRIFGNNIAHIHAIIYNQYGQKVFESRDIGLGWDGTYKGEGQPAGIYIYYAEVTYYDGHVAQKKGTITLIK